MKIMNQEKLKAKLARIPVAARKEIKAALASSAQEMAAVARAFVPKRTGALAASIGYTFGAYRADNANVRGVSFGGALNDPDLSVTIHAGNAKAYYAAFVEFGTRAHVAGGKFKGADNPGTAAQPYFFPAYRLTKKKLRSKISRATTRAAKRVAAG